MGGAGLVGVAITEARGFHPHSVSVLRRKQDCHSLSLARLH